MNFNAFLSKDADPVQPMDKVLENHFVNIEKGQFDPATFCSGKYDLVPQNDISV